MNTEKDWIDLPNDDYTLVLGYRNESSLQLSKLVGEYNQIAKDREDQLPLRIQALERVEKHLESWIKEGLTKVEKKKHLQWLLSLAVKKKNYLVALDKIYALNLETDAALEEYHCAIQDQLPPSLTPVLLNNKRFFSLKMREYWGDFWLESLDPCHRRLTPFYLQWMERKKENPNLPHFFLWLETQHLPRYVPVVHYLSEEELKQAHVRVERGQFISYCQGSAQPVNFVDPSERYLFVIDTKEQLYVTTESRGCSHSSFTHGKPVLGAGLINIRDGVLERLALESGHYLPSVEVGYTILKLFDKMGVIWPRSFEIVYFFDRNKYSADVKREDLSSLESFIESLDRARTTECATVG